jgi:hypothetical protein
MSTTHTLPLCTGCCRPWTSSRYRTCEKCRARSQRQYQQQREQQPHPNSDPFTRYPRSSIHPRAKKRRVAENAGASEAVRLALGLLEEEFTLRETASRQFPSEISSSHIRSSITRYEDEMLASSERSICCSCGGFFPSGDTHEIGDQDERLQGMRLDRCGYHENSWHFCRLCHTAISQWRVPKFSASNSVNVTMCQEYPAALEDLTPVEECLIAKCHPVGTILKLRPGGHVSTTNYSVIVTPQEPGPLLQILPCPEPRLESLIKIFWPSKTPPTNRD